MVCPSVYPIFLSFTDVSLPLPNSEPARKPEPYVAAEQAEKGITVSTRSKPIQKPAKVKQEPTHAQKLEKDKRTLFVGNLPITLSKSSLESPFKPFGKIESSRFRSCPVKEKYQKQNKKFGVMRRDFVEGVDEAKLTQNAYIVFTDAATVTKIMETSNLSSTDLFKSGHHIRLDYVVRPEVESGSSGAVKKFDRKKSIYIPHLPSTVTDVDVETVIEAADESFKNNIKGVRVVRSAKAGTFAYVLFGDRASATKAIKIGSIDHKFTDKVVQVRFVRIMKDEEIVVEKRKKQEEARRSVQIAAKKSLSRMKWQARLTHKGNPKVVSHHAMPRKERQEKMNKVARKLFGTKK